MKRLPSAMLLARWSGSAWCISEELPRSETLSPCALMAFFVAASWSGANSGRLGRSRSPRMQRISTAENLFEAAKSRICAKGHLGQPRVENAKRGFSAVGTRKPGARAVRAEEARNSLRVVLILNLLVLAAWPR